MQGHRTTGVMGIIADAHIARFAFWSMGWGADVMSFAAYPSPIRARRIVRVVGRPAKCNPHASPARRPGAVRATHDPALYRDGGIIGEAYFEPCQETIE